MASDLFFRLNNVNIQLSRYELPIVILLGNIGNFANIIVFSRRTLRTNVCSMYFICLSIVHLILLNFHGLPRVIAITTGSDITRTIPAFCKIRSYLFTLAIILSRHAICLISIDRWLVSSAKVALRQMSSLRSARWILGISVTFWLLFSIHPLIGFDSAFWGCSLWPGTVYALFYSLYSIITSLLTLVSVKEQTESHIICSPRISSLFFFCFLDHHDRVQCNDSTEHSTFNASNNSSGDKCHKKFIESKNFRRSTKSTAWTTCQTWCTISSSVYFTSIDVRCSQFDLDSLSTR